MEEGIECSNEEQVPVRPLSCNYPQTLNRPPPRPLQSPLKIKASPKKLPYNFQPPSRPYQIADQDQDILDESVVKVPVFKNQLQNPFSALFFCLFIEYKKDQVTFLPDTLPIPEGLKQLSPPYFDSSFPGGNLFSVSQRKAGVKLKEYDLLLQNDLNSLGNTQWFYFSVSGVQPGTALVFHILNLQKSDSLFNYGLKPAVLANQSQGWHREGKQVRYVQSQIKRQGCRKYYYTLSFTYQFKSKEKVYFAHSVPYFPEDFFQFLKTLDAKAKLFRLSLLCRSLLNNQVKMLTLGQTKDLKKQTVIVLCRQHPGQTPASFVLEGLLKNLLGKSKEAQFLKKYYNFIIVPFMNIDGVYLGNYRCNALGLDMNRNWNTVRHKKFFPQIHSIKNMVFRNKRIRLIIDLHAHSRCFGSFIYGNPDQSGQIKTLALLLSKLNVDFQLPACNFSADQSKRNTARLYLAGSVGMQKTFTLETSFFGSIRNGLKHQFSLEDLRKLGSDLAVGLFHLFSQDFSKEKKQTLYKMAQKELLQIKDQYFKGQQSDSDPEQCQLCDIQLQNILESSSKKSRVQSLRRVQIQRRPARDFRFLKLNKVQAFMPDDYFLRLEPTSTINQKQVLTPTERNRPHSHMKGKRQQGIQCSWNSGFNWSRSSRNNCQIGTGKGLVILNSRTFRSSLQ